MRTVWGLTLLSALLACSGCGAPDPAPVRVDHHVHLNAPEILEFLDDFCERVARYGGCDPALSAPLAPDDLIADMDAAGVARAALLSTGYLAESRLMDRPREDAHDLLRAANDWTVAQARQHPERFRAFIAVSPGSPHALSEIARWGGDPDVAGVKIHLTSAAVSLLHDEPAAWLSSIFAAAGDAGFAIIIHMRAPVPGFGAADMERFLAEVLPAAGGMPVQIAHIGGWGGIDDPTLAALGAFAEAQAARPGEYANVWFDLAGVLQPETPDEHAHALAALIQEIGSDRFLIGSDWPFSRDLDGLYGADLARLGLDAADQAVIAANMAPYFIDRD